VPPAGSVRASEIVILDLVEGLPQFDQYNALLVVIDKFTKYGHFIPIKHPYTALHIAQIFMNNVYKLHCLPKTIILDRDPVFTSAVWQQLFRLSDTKPMMSSSYHPQTDGQTERLNQCVEGFLRCTVHSCPRRWSKWISMAEFWYNTSVVFHQDLPYPLPSLTGPLSHETQLLFYFFYISVLYVRGTKATNYFTSRMEIIIKLINNFEWEP
jgi:hypothetical protein